MQAANAMLADLHASRAVLVMIKILAMVISTMKVSLLSMLLLLVVSSVAIGQNYIRLVPSSYMKHENKAVTPNYAGALAAIKTILDNTAETLCWQKIDPQYDKLMSEERSKISKVTQYLVVMDLKSCTVNMYPETESVITGNLQNLRIFQLDLLPDLTSSKPDKIYVVIEKSNGKNTGNIKALPVYSSYMTKEIVNELAKEIFGKNNYKVHWETMTHDKHAAVYRETTKSGEIKMYMHTSDTKEGASAYCKEKENATYGNYTCVEVISLENYE